MEVWSARNVRVSSYSTSVLSTPNLPLELTDHVAAQLYAERPLVGNANGRCVHGCGPPSVTADRYAKLEN